MVHRRTIEGEVLVFGNQGALWRNAMTWWDHDSGSIWSQPQGEALAGPRQGQRLDLLPSQFTSWRAWREAHPATLALDAPGQATGFDLADFYIVVDLPVGTRAYAVSDLRQVGIINDSLGELDLAVVLDPDDHDRWAVFARTIGDQIIDVEIDGSEIRDRRTGSTFDPVSGLSLSGPLAGLTLTRLPTLTTFPGGGPTRILIYEEFWPEGTVWRPS